VSAKLQESLLEAAFWLVPAVGAAWLFWSGGKRERASWGLVSAACAVIVTDKLVDLQTWLLRSAKASLRGLDPEQRMRGEHLWMRVLLLGSLMAAGVVGLWLWARLDRARTWPKRAALAGLALVVLFLGMRLFPRFNDWTGHPRDLVVEAAAWLLVAGGVGYGWRTKTRSELVATRGPDGSAGSR